MITLFTFSKLQMKISSFLFHFKTGIKTGIKTGMAFPTLFLKAYFLRFTINLSSFLFIGIINYVGIINYRIHSFVITFPPSTQPQYFFILFRLFIFTLLTAVLLFCLSIFIYLIITEFIIALKIQSIEAQARNAFRNAFEIRMGIYRSSLESLDIQKECPLPQDQPLHKKTLRL